MSFLFIAFCIAITFGSETGMCLIVTNTRTSGGTESFRSAYFCTGNIRRIDVQNSRVINTSGVIGRGFCPRFAPDGNSFAYISGGNIVVASLEGTILKQFPAAISSKMNLSFTNNGIYLGGEGAFRCYSPTTGALLQTLNRNYCTQTGFVSQNGAFATSGATVNGTGKIGIHHLTSSNDFAASSGCSACPSPSGAFCTNNLWESGKEHYTMNILNTSNGSVSKYLNMGTVLGLDQSFCWNAQTWSGNSENIICIPVGGIGNQFTHFCEPWIYNINTRETIQLASKSGTFDFWQPYDFYSGKLPGPQTRIQQKPSIQGFSVVPGGETGILFNILGKQLSNNFSRDHEINGPIQSGGVYYILRVQGQTDRVIFTK